MYKHHEESIENMISYFKQQGAVALILGGSVAKGTARADSDLDGFVILTEEDYAQKEKTHTTTETINGMCTYEDGYFDIKYMTKEYLKELAQKGSEPARNGFTRARILFDCNRRLEEQVASISPQTADWVKAAKKLEVSQEIQDADVFVEMFLRITTYIPPANINEVLTTYSKDFQEWWRNPRPNICEW